MIGGDPRLWDLAASQTYAMEARRGYGPTQYVPGHRHGRGKMSRLTEPAPPSGYSDGLVSLQVVVWRFQLLPGFHPTSRRFPQW